MIAISTYELALAVHIIAVVAAFGLPLAYPLLVPYVRRMHPHAMPGLHDVQHRLNQRITGPGIVVILVLGIYMTTDKNVWDEPFVMVGMAAIVIIGALGGAVILPMTRKLSELASVDVAAAPGAATVTWSAEYERLYRRYMAAELTLAAVVLVTIFFMAAKPFG